MATLLYLDHALALRHGLQEEVAIVTNQEEGYLDALQTLAEHDCYGEARVVPYVDTPYEALTGEPSLVKPFGARNIMHGDVIWFPFEKKQPHRYFLYGPTMVEIPSKAIKQSNFHKKRKVQVTPKGVEFNISDTLNHMLMMTDINDDIPAFALRLPYPNIYLDFQHHKELVLDYQNSKYPVQGVHLIERTTSTKKRTIAATVVLFGNVEINFPPILIDYEGQPAYQLLHKEHGFDKLMMHIIKLLLFMNGKSLTEQEFKALKPIRQERVRQTNFVLPSKPTKPIRISVIHNRKQQTSTQRVLNDTYTPIGAHYRRGHLKMVRYGAKMLKKKVKWIMPTVVNFHLLGPNMTKEVALKMYKVTL